MAHPFDTEKMKALAQQLSCPDGEDGIKTGEQMSINNGGMTTTTIDSLALGNHEKVLEIGPGNGRHIRYVLSKAEAVAYVGIDISDTMIREARTINASDISAGRVLVEKTDGQKLDFGADFFDRVFTVNTVYFWKDPLAYAAEIHRVLRAGGTLHLTFALKEFMQKLPFTTYGFQLYDVAEAVLLLEKAKFIIKDIQLHTEDITSNAGHTLSRTYAVVIAGT